MKLFVATLLSCCLLPFASAHADTPSHDDLLRLARAAGMYEQIEAQKEALRNQGAGAGKQYIEQISAALPGLPKQFYRDVDAELKVLMDGMAALIDTDKAIKIYAELLAAHLSADEVRSLSEFYESPLGQAYTRANIAIMAAWSEALMRDAETQTAALLQRYMDNLVAKAYTYAK